MLHLTDFLPLLGDPVSLRSRAAKRAKILVNASAGIAVSVQGTSPDFVEVFPPCTHEEYLREIYREPPRFIR
jgi:hypothetical protein